MSEGDGAGSALGVWQAKLEQLEYERAVAADPNLKFQLNLQIDEARREVARLDVTAAVGVRLPNIDIGRLDRYAPVELVGREAELEVLDAAWSATGGSAPNVLSIVALGGEGKTSLVAHWLAMLAQRDWPGCTHAFAWSFYSQGTRELAASSSDLFISSALRFFGDEATADSPLGGYEKGRRLARLIGDRRALLVLDGLEPLQFPPTAPEAGRLRDAGIEAFLKGLAAHNSGLCVVTTRYAIEDLRTFRRATAEEHALERLSDPAGVALLRSLDIRGSEPELSALVERVDGHALAITIIGSYLRDAYGGDVRQAERVRFDVADREVQGGHAYRAMGAYASWLGTDSAGERALSVLRVVGLFDRPVSVDCLRALMASPAIQGLSGPLVGLDDAARNVVLSRLERARLITMHHDGTTLVAIDAHPLVREYFAHDLATTDSGAWQAGHRRLFDHLCATTVEGDEPTLEGLQPLFQAIVHGCHAGLHQAALDDVYWARVWRGDELYSTLKLGAFGADLAALAVFFTAPWDQPHPDLSSDIQNWLICEVGFRLRAIARLGEATGPLTTGYDQCVAAGKWANACICAMNLCELWLATGDIPAAIDAADMAIAHVERTDDLHMQLSAHAWRAAVWHQHGRLDDATTEFAHAEALQTRQSSGQRWLYSLPGFRYCELLLSPAEYTAWQHCSTLGTSSTRSPAAVGDALERCRTVTERAHLARSIATRHRVLLDIGLATLTIARAHLYHAVLTTTPVDLTLADAAIDSLRESGQLDYLVAGLLTRAWTHATLTHFDDAHQDDAIRDLDDAFDIASRGPMRLHLADVHLHHAHFFRHLDLYPWTSPTGDLDTAQRLITACGYHRRQPQLDFTRSLVRL